MEIFSGIVDFDHSAVDAFAIAFIASGILACFFGYRLLRVVLGVTGFIAVGSLVWTLRMNSSQHSKKFPWCKTVTFQLKPSSCYGG